LANGRSSAALLSLPALCPSTPTRRPWAAVCAALNGHRQPALPCASQSSLHGPLAAEKNIPSFPGLVSSRPLAKFGPGRSGRQSGGHWTAWYQCFSGHLRILSEMSSHLWADLSLVEVTSLSISLTSAAQDYLRKVPPPLSTVQVSLCLHLEHQRGPAHLYPVPASVAACWAAYAPAPSRRPALYLPVSAPGLLGSSQAVSRVIVTTSPTHNPRHSAIGRKFQRIVNDSMEC